MGEGNASGGSGESRQVDMGGALGQRKEASSSWGPGWPPIPTTVWVSLLLTLMPGDTCALQPSEMWQWTDSCLAQLKVRKWAMSSLFPVTTSTLWLTLSGTLC